LADGLPGPSRHPVSAGRPARRVGFANAKELFAVADIKHVISGDSWVVSNRPRRFDKDGTHYSSPYKIPVSKQLPVP
jgi:hypothetical protein